MTQRLLQLIFPEKKKVEAPYVPPIPFTPSEEFLETAALNSTVAMSNYSLEMKMVGRAA